LVLCASAPAVNAKKPPGDLTLEVLVWACKNVDISPRDRDRYDVDDSLGFIKGMVDGVKAVGVLDSYASCALPEISAESACEVLAAFAKKHPEALKKSGAEAMLDMVDVQRPCRNPIRE
jgi:hypothetical protein